MSEEAFCRQFIISVLQLCRNITLLCYAVARQGSMLYVFVFGSILGHQHSSLYPPIPPTVQFPVPCLSLRWNRWERCLPLLRGGGPISKTGACKIVPFRHSSGSESNRWTDAWLPRGSLMMVVTCSTYFSPSLLSLPLACAGCKGGEAALGALGTPLAATFLAGRFLTPFTCMRVQSLLCWKGQAAV